MTAPPSFSLASRPWLTVIDTSGRTHRCSLAEALENAGRLHLAAPDPLLWAATARLLTAVAYSAGCAPPDDDAYWANITGGIDLTAAVDWVREHTADLDLFAPDRPLFQDGALHEVSHLPEATMPVLYLDLSAAIGRPCCPTTGTCTPPSPSTRGGLRSCCWCSRRGRWAGGSPPRPPCSGRAATSGGPPLPPAA